MARKAYFLSTGHVLHVRPQGAARGGWGWFPSSPRSERFQSVPIQTADEPFRRGRAGAGHAHGRVSLHARSFSSAAATPTISWAPQVKLTPRSSINRAVLSGSAKGPEHPIWLHHDEVKGTPPAIGVEHGATGSTCRSAHAEGGSFVAQARE